MKQFLTETIIQLSKVKREQGSKTLDEDQDMLHQLSHSLLHYQGTEPIMNSPGQHWKCQPRYVHKKITLRQLEPLAVTDKIYTVSIQFVVCLKGGFVHVSTLGVGT